TLSNGEILCADSVVLACGSGSSATMPKLDYLIDNRMLTPTSPSLTPIKLVSPYKILNGLRAKVNVILNKDGAPIAIEKGEILFKEYGVTGICIFNLSAIIARNKSQNINGKYSLSIDLLPMFSVQQLQTLLSIRKDRGYNLQNIFLGLLSNKLAECVIDRAKVDMLNKLDIIQLVSTAKNFAFDVVGNLDFSMSQVTSGGVDDKYLTDKLSLPNGVSVIGELLNIDGLCGGYNLYIAIASAIMVGEQ
ncbi:MAG: NAD(P)/FAD-dependent oxidoreductase, partial [Clostridia bacterium]